MESLWNFVETIGSITRGIWYEVDYCIKINMRYLSILIELALPYCMYMLGQVLAIARGGIKVGGELFIPITVMLVTYYTKELANKSGKGNTIPIPNRRFTEVDDDGEVSVENNRIQELLLYVADLEDWLERKGHM